MTDKELIEQLKRGDLPSYEALMERYTPYVLAVIKRVGKERLTYEDLEEIASEVFLKLWQKRKKLEIQAGKEKAYIGVMTRNETLNYLRKCKRLEELPLEEDWLELSEELGPEQQLLNKEKRSLIRDALEQLSETEQTLFVRRYFYFEKVMDIAKSLGMKEQTVATKLFRGKQKLEALLRERGIKG
ncbi:hypothetical protein CS063_12250 [Sporanaerobium hydrogeniformans]|uniref:Uncharacterized protein n=1 Tax=Sporanaerobium hydrogeniformans TaxID=3072179 RepID=A0AC61DB24_9FIRM|nr:sigma-70 family RNA polymerase sigma factor [Sporanaerobium hydrogeniformans]PHV70070.1 hypothetical protein CS063_12250 [Sporanaerobium hydrogeniformans]